jgi:hypothetical protein
MTRNEEAIAGQLWIQSGRQMTASNKVISEMANPRDSAVLSAAAEAVTWQDPQECEVPRKGQRVVIYPKDLPQLEAVLNAGDPNIDSVDGHPIAYEAILRANQSFENHPIFLKEDSEQITNHPEFSEKVPEWMAITKQVATGNRKRVLENGDDKMNSDDSDDPDMKPDELTGMYTEGMDPEKGPVQLTKKQVASQKAVTQALKAIKPPSESRFPTPVSSDTEDQSEMT